MESVVNSYDPNWAKLWGRKGLCHYYLKDYDEAVVSFQQQLDLDPDNIEARVRRGTA
jgi:tetratricopeptide (TPR) repeat protein